MSKSINQCLLVGNVGRDPETRTLDGGTRVATFSLATSTGGYKRSDGTDVPEKTQWHNIVCWRGLADVAARCVRKGDRLTVLGTITYHDYETADGGKRRATDILAYDIVLGGNPGTGTRPAPTEGDAPTRDDFPAAAAMQDGDDLPF